MEYTTILHLRHVTFAHEGRYQCIITNHFGSTYSSKARLIVNGRLFFKRLKKVWADIVSRMLTKGIIYIKMDNIIIMEGERWVVVVRKI